MRHDSYFGIDLDLFDSQIRRTVLTEAEGAVSRTSHAISRHGKISGSGDAFKPGPEFVRTKRYVLRFLKAAADAVVSTATTLFREHQKASPSSTMDSRLVFCAFAHAIDGVTSGTGFKHDRHKGAVYLEILIEYRDELPTALAFGLRNLLIECISFDVPSNNPTPDISTIEEWTELAKEYLSTLIKTLDDFEEPELDSEVVEAIRTLSNKVAVEENSLQRKQAELQAYVAGQFESFRAEFVENNRGTVTDFYNLISGGNRGYGRSLTKPNCNPTLDTLRSAANSLSKVVFVSIGKIELTLTSPSSSKKLAKRLIESLETIGSRTFVERTGSDAKAYATTLGNLKKNPNKTIKTLVEIAHSLGSNVRIQFDEK